MNNKGDSNLGGMMWIFVFFSLLALIAVSIVGYNFIFYGKGYNTKALDAIVLNFKIRECLSENALNKVFGESEISGESLSSGSGATLEEKFFELCNFNKKIIEENFILRICEGNVNCVTEDKGVLVQTGSNFNICEFGAAQKSGRFVQCAMEEYYKDGRNFVIITGSKQETRRFEG